MALSFTRLVTLLAVGGAGVFDGRGEPSPSLHSSATTILTTTTPTSSAPGRGTMVATGTDPLDMKGPIVADGSVEMIPSRVNMRCRFAFVNEDRDYKLYRIFMASRGFPYDDWCESVERNIKAQCGTEVDKDKVKWIRCDPEGKDLLWEKGYIVTFELHVKKKDRPQCVKKALLNTVPGSVIDWMHGVGCYESFGFEMEYQ